MEQLIGTATTVAVEILTILILSLVALALNKGKGYIAKLEEKDKLGIIDLVTDQVVTYAEAELKGQSGIMKRNFAVSKALEILESKGINVPETEVITGIENGVKKMKMDNQFLTPFQDNTQMGTTIDIR